MEKHRVKIQCTPSKYKHRHKAFVEALNKLLVKNLFKVQDAQELDDPKKNAIILGKASVWINGLT